MGLRLFFILRKESESHEQKQQNGRNAGKQTNDFYGNTYDFIYDAASSL